MSRSLSTWGGSSVRIRWLLLRGFSTLPLAIFILSYFKNIIEKSRVDFHLFLVIIPLSCLKTSVISWKVLCATSNYFLWFPSYLSREPCVCDNPFPPPCSFSNNLAAKVVLGRCHRQNGLTLRSQHISSKVCSKLTVKFWKWIIFVFLRKRDRSSSESSPGSPQRRLKMILRSGCYLKIWPKMASGHGCDWTRAIFLCTNSHLVFYQAYSKAVKCYQLKQNKNFYTWGVQA